VDRWGGLAHLLVESGNVGTYARIDLYDDTAYSQTIAASTSVIGQSFLWFIPTALVGDAKYRIRISSNQQSRRLRAQRLFYRRSGSDAVRNRESGFGNVVEIGTFLPGVVVGYRRLPVSDIKLELYDSTDFVGTVVSRTPCQWGTTSGQFLPH